MRPPRIYHGEIKDSGDYEVHDNTKQSDEDGALLAELNTLHGKSFLAISD